MAGLLNYQGLYAKVRQVAFPAFSIPRYKKKKVIQVVRQVGKESLTINQRHQREKLGSAPHPSASLSSLCDLHNFPLVQNELVIFAAAATCVHSYAARRSAAVNAVFTEERQPAADEAVYCDFQRPHLLLSC